MSLDPMGRGVKRGGRENSLYVFVINDECENRAQDLLGEKKMNLSESEEKFLLKLEKNLEKAYIVYISVAISLCGAVLCLIMGLVGGSEKSLQAALFLAILGISLFSIMHAYQKMFKIASKLKNNLENIEGSGRDTTQGSERQGAGRSVEGAED